MENDHHEWRRREGGEMEREGERERRDFSFSQYQWGCRHALMRFQSMLHFPSDPISLLPKIQSAGRRNPKVIRVIYTFHFNEC